ncbi:uncharacterized protein LOC133791440 [Humulus lupulus]|uniref:uncharacterized protein LOC133791440 n=1 Tax=Humulus lupulus TaxID=3486 RepID=UPI002B4178BD|nr:uncharacterized protein LOC133791440 [Humulus lupulus]
MNQKVARFNGCYKRVQQAHHSGWSDEQILENAHQLYKSENNNSNFLLVDCWRLLKDELKWNTMYQPKCGKRKKVSESGAFTSSSNADIRDDEVREVRPIVSRRGLSPLQKCTAAMRMLAYGAPANYADEYVRIGETTAIECLVNFVQGVNDIFGTEYLRRPNAGDIRRLLQMGESGVHLLKLSHCLKERKENYLPDAKKRYAKMLSEHSEYFNLVLLLYEDQHVFGKRDVLKDIMYACIILHNIIVEDERDAYDDGPADTLMVEVLH